MSVTFLCPFAERIEVTPYPDTEPDYTELRSVLPEVNMANTTARAVLRLLGLDDEELVGTIELANMPAVRQRVVALLNRPEQRRSEVHSPQVLGSRVVVREEGGIPTIGRTCTVIDGGLPDERLLRKLSELLGLLVAAQEGGQVIHWG